MACVLGGLCVRTALLCHRIPSVLPLYLMTPYSMALYLMTPYSMALYLMALYF